MLFPRTVFEVSSRQEFQQRASRQACLSGVAGEEAVVFVRSIVLTLPRSCKNSSKTVNTLSSSVELHQPLAWLPVYTEPAAEDFESLVNSSSFLSQLF